MRLGLAFANFVVIFLSSCGLETVEYLPPPDVTYYQAQTDKTVVTLTHDPNRFSGTHFAGYEVFYRVYPLSSSNVSSNLADDVARLSATPTRDFLLSLGYQRMNGSSTHATAEPLVAVTTSVSIELNMTNLVSLDPTTTVIGLNGIQTSVSLDDGTSIPVYRTVVQSGTGIPQYPWFNELYSSPFVKTSDMAPSVAAAGDYEIDLFLASYSFTPERISYSEPVAWGVLGPFTAGH